MDTYHVIIVGAGPAGAACAKALCEAGIRVLIIERESLPRHKTCSGVLFGQTQVLVQNIFNAQPPAEVFCEPKQIQAANILEWRSPEDIVPYCWEIPKDGKQFPQTYYNIHRATFDHWLVRQSGAEVRQHCLFRGFSLHEDKIQVNVFLRDAKTLEPGGTGKPEQTLYCDYLVGADGGSSAVRRALEPDWWTSTPDVIVYQEYCHIRSRGALQDGCWYVFFEKSIGDILCCVHRKDNCLVLCVGGFKGRDVRAGMEIFKSFLHEKFSVVLGKQERVEGCIIKPGPPYLGKGRVLLTGEAAGLLYLNGEGISAALDSGYRCGTALARAIREGGDAEAYYQAGIQDILHHVQICAERMHFLV